MDPIEHCLDTASVTVPSGGRVAKEIRRDMLNGIQSKAIAFGSVKGPHHRTNEISIHVFGDGHAIGTVEGTPRAAERWGGRIHIIFGIVRLANERDFRNCTAQGVSEIAVG